MKNRPEIVGEQIRRELVELMTRGMKDPRIGFATISRVTVTRDMSLATVAVSVMGSDKEVRDTMIGLNHSAGWMRRQLGAVLHMRMIPELKFVHDRNLENSFRIQEILGSLPELREPPADAPDATDGNEGGEETPPPAPPKD